MCKFSDRLVERQVRNCVCELRCIFGIKLTGALHNAKSCNARDKVVPLSHKHTRLNVASISAFVGGKWQWRRLTLNKGPVKKGDS
jgi:hypothetical protein